jgi:hypothetical protein
MKAPAALTGTATLTARRASPPAVFNSSIMAIIQPSAGGSVTVSAETCVIGLLPTFGSSQNQSLAGGERPYVISRCGMGHPQTVCAVSAPGVPRAQLAALALDITVAHSSYRQNSIPGNKILIQLSVLVAARVSRDACPCPISCGPTDAGAGAAEWAMAPLPSPFPRLCVMCFLKYDSARNRRRSGRDREGGCRCVEAMNWCLRSSAWQA